MLIDFPEFLDVELADLSKWWGCFFPNKWFWMKIDFSFGFISILDVFFYDFLFKSLKP